MALVITAGYDFSVNEVPTNQKLKLMLNAMIISGIPRGNLDVGLAGVYHGWLSGTSMTTLPNEGDVMYDLNGDIYVKARNGPVAIRKQSLGGLETNRFKAGASYETIGVPSALDNFYGRLESLTASNLDFDSVYYRPATSGGQTVYVMHQITNVSLQHPRIIMAGSRRATALVGSGNWPRANIGQEYALEKTGSNINEWRVDEIPAENADSAGLGAKIGIVGPEEANNARAPGWLYGADIMVV